MVLSNYEGKTSKPLGRQWLHGVGCVPSSMHQRIIIWKPDGIVERIEADQSFFRADVNHIDRLSFDQKLANISPCRPTGEGINFEGREVCYKVTLQPQYWFTCEYETIGGYNRWSESDKVCENG